MKCTNLLIGLIIIYACLDQMKCMRQSMPSDLAKFTQNVDGYQNVMRYFQMLNNMNNINNMSNLNNFNPSLNSMNSNQMNNIGSSINPLQQQMVKYFLS
jgi:hypothetical protein